MNQQTEYALAVGGTIAINDEDFVRARYVTRHGGDHPVTGNVTKIKYGMLNNGRILPVHKKDLGPAGIGGTFTVIQEKRVKLPERQEVEETPAPVTLPGVAVKETPEPVPAPEPIAADEPEELPPFAFDPDDVLRTVSSLQSFISSDHSSPHLLQALLEIERAGKNRKTAVKELEAAIG